MSTTLDVLRQSGSSTLGASGGRDGRDGSGLLMS
jgi:hypothetical protein